MLSNKAAEETSGSHIIEATVQNFMHEVIQASLQVPVVVYFTATWCTPCKQFGPTLEKVVNDAKGRLKLARVDIDKNPQLAQQFRIQSVPMVYIFVGGQPVDGFSGAMQESQLKQLFAQFMQATPEEEDAKEMLKQAAMLLEAGDAQTAMRYFQAVLQMEPENVEAIAGLASAFIATGNLEQAEALLKAVPETGANHEAVVAANARLNLAKNAPKPEALEKLHKALAANPADHQARSDLAAALYASGNAEEAVEELLKVIAADKEWNDGAARKQLLTMFEALGFENPVAQTGRRKLSAILFK
ncbi:MAG TPA: co-chaperone YbbN [Rickettsiales bacterium]|nr:co-chaperone YbbN [Rickettsiales bacterium]